MKRGVKLLAGCLLMLSLSACGDTEEEIVYEESLFEVPREYVLGEKDTAPAFYSHIFTYIDENVAPPVETTEVPEGVELTKEEEKYLEEEAERLTAANELLQSELDKENYKLNSIRVVTVQDPSEKNAAAIAEATEAHELAKAEAASEAFSVIPTEEQLAAEDENGTTTTTVAVVEEDDTSYLYEVEQEAFVYTYDVGNTGFSGGQATGGYTDVMLSSGFKIIDPYHPVGIEYYSMLTPDFTQRAGTVAFAKLASGTERLMLVTVDWHYYGATVTVEYITGTLWVAPKKASTASKGSLTISDAVGFLETRNPSDLGLEGNTMEDYNIYTAEGLVMIGGVPYREFIISGKATGGNGNTYGGTYLIDADGNSFTVDPVHGTITPMTITNVYDTLS